MDVYAAGVVIADTWNTGRPGHKIQLWHIVVVAFPSALLATLRMTAGSAMVVDVVGRQLVFGANAASTAITNIARFAGPALGGWLLAKHGADIAFYFVFFSLTTCAIFLWFIRTENPVKADKSKLLLVDFKLGITYIVGTPELRWLAVLALSILAAGISMPLVPRCYGGRTQFVPCSSWRHVTTYVAE